GHTERSGARHERNAVEVPMSDESFTMALRLRSFLAPLRVLPNQPDRQEFITPSRLQTQDSELYLGFFASDAVREPAAHVLLADRAHRFRGLCEAHEGAAMVRLPCRSGG